MSQILRVFCEILGLQAFCLHFQKNPSAQAFIYNIPL